MNTVPITPLPWSARFDEAITIRDAQDNQLAILTHIHTRSGGRRSTNEVEANAKFIVKACAEYASLKSRADAVDGLVEALMQISNGSFPEAIGFALGQDWHGFTDKLQSIATTALAKAWEK